jgi:hypothetical protein
MFIPFIGPILAFYFFYNTGVVFEALGIANNINPAGLFFTTFLTPVAWLEFLAYSTAIAGSIWLSVRILQGKTRHEVVNTAKFVSICAVVLLIGAVIEAVLVYATA